MVPSRLGTTEAHMSNWIKQFYLSSDTGDVSAITQPKLVFDLSTLLDLHGLSLIVFLELFRSFARSETVSELQPVRPDTMQIATLEAVYLTEENPSFCHQINRQIG